MGQRQTNNQLIDYKEREQFLKSKSKLEDTQRNLQTLFTFFFLTFSIIFLFLILNKIKH